MVSNTPRKDLHELVDALPPGEEQAARRYLEYLRDASDPFAHLDKVDLELHRGSTNYFRTGGDPPRLDDCFAGRGHCTAAGHGPRPRRRRSTGSR